MFDPFNDFEQAGYLRNNYKEKDSEIVRELEHTMFRAGLDDALVYLEQRDILRYEDFLEVHRILFQEFYPWAGQDRAVTAPNCSVSKAGTIFCHPQDARRAVDEGLRIGQNKDSMRKHPGEVMGFFAYGHPFLDGNGRTMLIIHNELCHRAGFSINWHLTKKIDYLRALSAEIESPLKGHLDCYLGHFIGQSQDRGFWRETIHGLQGLDGQSIQNTVDGEYSDALVAQKYQSFEFKRSL
ncbi:Fic family protein [Acinetobacter gyllenbergii]|uniref:Fic/DOC family protein n=1 Tax=Acinetobacter gyllenbergii TaxID=134534 RepID=UPI0021D36997|nr:Fic family protein [Acinetobacter gyllenbergii]MCU4582643.1 Fic family protein [Acinetobacter gyllenbergii]